MSIQKRVAWCAEVPSVIIIISFKYFVLDKTEISLGPVGPIGADLVADLAL
jgi:hypothetical protein